MTKKAKINNIMHNNHTENSLLFLRSIQTLTQSLTLSYLYVQHPYSLVRELCLKNIDVRELVLKSCVKRLLKCGYLGNTNDDKFRLKWSNKAVL